MSLMTSFPNSKSCSGFLIILCYPFQGVVDVLCEACEQLKWKNPSKIQKEALPVAFAGKYIGKLK